MATNVLNIMSDETFIESHMELMNIKGVKNTFIYLQDFNTYNGPGKENILYINPYSKEYYDLISSSTNYDIIIFYYLDKNKIDFINKFQKERVLIVWYFYGADLYFLKQIKETVLSSKTKELLYNRYQSDLKGLLRNIISKVKYFLIRDNVKLWKAISKIDFFAWYSKEEYEYLNRVLNNKLPAFLEISVRTRFDNINSNYSKSLGIVLGNSGSPYNNHIDILTDLSLVKFKENIIVPVSYAKQSEYIQSLKQFGELSNLKIKFLEEFIPFNEYVRLLATNSTFILNSHRQMALGNIFIALRCGVKVYLSESNPSYRWLQRIGFVIHSVENNLKIDVINQKLFEDLNNIKVNENICMNLFNNRMNSEFTDLLKNFESK